MEPTGAQRGGRGTIGLAMIVKNEGAVIDRCLASVRDLIDTWTIIDTGSTDDTRARITEALANVPGTLHERPWVNFGANRTELMALARHSADYLLLIDADMTVRVEGELGELEGDGYLLLHDEPVRYRIPRLVSGAVAWRFVGATHEYLDGGPTHQVRAFLDTWVIEHHGDGGSRADKFERDRRLLEEAVASDPDDPRSVFYLAQTLADLGLGDDAIEMYRHRISLGGWDEEVFISQFRIGTLLAERDWPAAVAALLEAWELRPTRAEPLYQLARGYRIRDHHRLAEHFARLGLAIPFPSGDLLFVEREPYDWGLAFERSIAVFWCGDPTESLRLCDALLASGLPDAMRGWVEHNRTAALTALAARFPSGPDELSPQFARVDMLVGRLDVRPLGRSVRGVTFEVIEADTSSWSPSPWPVFNPSIANLGSSFGLIVRASNYHLRADGNYQTNDAGPFRTRNLFRRLDANFRVTDERLLDEVPAGPVVYPSAVQGVEDLRLVRVGERDYGIGTVRDRNASAKCEMVLWDLSGGVMDATPVPLELLVTRPALVHEKNWMPFVDEGVLHVVYACNPLTVKRIDPSNGQTETVSIAHLDSSMQYLRGGSQGVAIGVDRWLFVAHEVIDTDDHDQYRRTYVHRMIVVEAEGTATARRFRIESMSDRFTFTGSPIEFCAGIAIDGDDLVCSFGVRDAHAMLARMPRSEVLRFVGGSQAGRIPRSPDQASVDT